MESGCYDHIIMYAMIVISLAMKTGITKRDGWMTSCTERPPCTKPKLRTPRDRFPFAHRYDGDQLRAHAPANVNEYLLEPVGRLMYDRLALMSDETIVQGTHSSGVSSLTAVA